MAAHRFRGGQTALLCTLLLACGDDGASPGLPPGWDTEVALPVAEDRNPDPGIVEVSLDAYVSTVQLVPGGVTAAWTYGGHLPGPLIRARAGDRLIVHFTNLLPASTTIHWHGLRIPAEMDGVAPHVPPGGQFVYDFVVPDAGTFWYHPHVDSAMQVGYGLYGALVVEDPDEPPALGDEVVLVLSDADIEPDGSFTPPDAGGSVADLFGREGSVLLVNGKVLPRLKVRAGKQQRWRIINAARSRYFWLELPGHRFTRIGGDGGLRERPLESDRLLVVPGERADVLVVATGAPGSETMLRWIPYDRGYGSTFAREPEDLLRLRVVGDAPPAAPLAATARTIAPLDTTGASTQAFEMTQDAVDGLNVLGFDHVTDGQFMLMAMVNTTQVWTVHNRTEWHHPFHLHGFFFQVLDASGQPLAAREWKDTVDVPDGETLRFAVHYDDRPGEWMFHCHILDHADMGMMGMLMVR